MSQPLHYAAAHTAARGLARRRRPRRHTRQRRSLPCRVRVVEPGAAFDAHTIDLSPYGVALLAPSPYREGADVELLLYLGENARRIPGVIVRQRRVMTGVFELGIEFVRPLESEAPASAGVEPFGAAIAGAP
jgi:hypothetical protein